MKSPTFQIILTLLLVLAAFSSSCQKSSNPISPGADFVSLPLYLQQWGCTGTANGQFTQVARLTLDNVGNIYVCDMGNNRIEKFDLNGKFLLTWGVSGSGTGQFSSPAAVASASGTVFVVDSGNNRIEAFDESGNYLAVWASLGSAVSQLTNPQALALDKNNNIYVADTGNNRIQEFFAAGAAAPVTWGVQGTGPASFESPAGIAIDASGNVFVADTLNNRIEKFTANGTYQNSWGTYGTNTGQFRNPEGLAFDGSGYLYVADSSNARVQEFDSSMNFVAQWGGLGVNQGQFAVPTGIAISPSPDYFFVSDGGTNMVKKFGPPADYAIFPDPVKSNDSLTIEFNSANFVGFQLLVEDLNDNVVFSDQSQAVAGANVVQWNCTSGGSRVQSGVYNVELNLGQSHISQKIAVIN